jgi:hypothetical protein
MKLHINWEALGFSAALICAIHCALFPLLIGSLPLLGVSFLSNIYFEAGLLLTAILIGGTSLWHGYRRHHHRITPLLSFSAGMGLFILNHLVNKYTYVLVIASTVLIVLAYIMNWQFCRKAKHCHAADCNH